MTSADDIILIRYADEPPDTFLDSAIWQAADATEIKTYWSGEAAPASRHFTARLLWSSEALYTRFDMDNAEPPIVSDKPDASAKSIGLWERDVCELFISPNNDEPYKYFEFEVAPTGEWLDLGIEVIEGERKTDWDLDSQMSAAARIDCDAIVMAIRVPFTAFGTAPKPNGLWPGNLFRCVGSGPTRGYLAWRPTMTPQPSFHVPSAFGKFRFVK